MARRLRCLQDFAAEGVDALVECRNHNCRRRVVMDPRRLLERIKREKWIHVLAVQGVRLRCNECGYRGARIAPIPRIVHPLDCDEFRADVARLWERIITESAAATEIFSTMAQLYEQEINCGVETFWDSGLTAFIGDQLNGRKVSETFPFDRIGEIPDWLLANARAIAQLSADE